MTFKIRKINPFINKLIEVFSERSGLDMSSLIFLYRGNIIKEEDTPKSVSLKFCSHFFYDVYCEYNLF